MLELIIESGYDKCIVEQSATQHQTSKCSEELVGTIHNAKLMLEHIKLSYGDGNFQDRNLRLPEHPHCTHTFSPYI